MNIRINGRDEKIGKAANIAELISDKGLSPARVVVEHNLLIVPQEEWVRTILKEDDNIEIVSFVGGG